MEMIVFIKLIAILEFKIEVITWFFI